MSNSTRHPWPLWTLRPNTPERPTPPTLAPLALPGWPLPGSRPDGERLPATGS